MKSHFNAVGAFYVWYVYTNIPTALRTGEYLIVGLTVAITAKAG